MEEKKIVINSNGKVVHLLTLFLVLSKLDGTMEITWMTAFLPFFISYFIPIVVEVICFIYNIIADIINGIANIINSFKKNQERNTSYGERMYWDAENNRMYGPFEMEEE